MEEIALELKRLNKTMAEILLLIQKEMLKSDEIRRKYDLEREQEEKKDADYAASWAMENMKVKNENN